MQIINEASDLTPKLIRDVAFANHPVSLSDNAIERMAEGRKRFQSLIAAGVPCYGVTTGLGRLSDTRLDDAAMADLPRNILRARAAAFGEPLPRGVVRAMMLLKLANFVGGADGVSPTLARFLVDRLNDGFTPWVPVLGHGMAADATANTHCFQTFIGEGYVFADDSDERLSADDALRERGVSAYAPGFKEGLALLNGIAVAPAFALYAHDAATRVLDLANAVAATSLEAMAAPEDAIDETLCALSAEPGTARVVSVLRQWTKGSEITAHKLQGPVSFRIVPQVHGAYVDALGLLEARVGNQARSFSDNPYMTEDGRFLSCGLFHNQHLVNSVEAVALALCHVLCLSERRLHRLMDPVATGLNAQLAARPGLDAGLVVLHKAAVDLVARARMLAQPVSVLTSETSAGQEDYMSMAVPAIDRLMDLIDIAWGLLASELLAACVALDQRDALPGDNVRKLHGFVREKVAPLDRDRSPGPDVELLREHLADSAFAGHLHSLLA